MARLVILVHIIWGISLGSNAQGRFIDSLKQRVYQAPNESEKLNALLVLCDEYQSLNRDSFDVYTLQLKQLAAKSGNERIKKLSAIVIANDYFRWGWLDSELVAIDPVIDHSSVDDDLSRVIYFKASRQKALYLGGKSKFAESLQILYQLLDQGEKFKDTLVISSNMNSISSIELFRNEPKKGLYWSRKALDYVNNNPRFESVEAAVYVNMAEAYKQLNKLDSASICSEKGVSLFRKGNNQMSLALALQRQSDIFLQNKDVDKAAAALMEMIDVRKQLGDGTMWTDDNLSLINLYIKANQIDKAISFCKSQLVSGNVYSKTDQGKTFVNDISQKLLYYEALARCYKIKGDSYAYQEMLEKIIQAKDSFYTARAEKAIAEVQTKYDLEQKENMIMHQQVIIVQKNNELLLSMFFALLLLALAYVFFRYYNKKQKLKVGHAIEREKNLSAKAVADAEENERKRIAADLHDNLGAYAASIASNLDFFNVDRLDDQYKLALEELRSNSQSIVSQLSDTIWVLNKDNLKLTAISDRIKLFLNHLNKSYNHINMIVTENIMEDVELKSTHAFHLFRIAQEAITNAVKHSKTDRLEVSFEENKGWKVMIRDFGIGTSDGGTLINYSGNGLRNMKTRAGIVGWIVKWTKNEPCGTIVTISPEKIEI